MKIKQVQLKNFRCFEKLEIDFHPELNVLVGINGVGKTAVLEGIVGALQNLQLGFERNPGHIHQSKRDGISTKDIRRNKHGGYESEGFLAVQTFAGERFELMLKPDFEKDEETGWIDKPEWTESWNSYATLRDSIVENPDCTDELPVFAYYPATRNLARTSSVTTDTKKHFSRLQPMKTASDAFSEFNYVVDWLYDLYVGELIEKDAGNSGSNQEKERQFIKKAVQSIVPEVKEISFTNKSPRKLLLKWSSPSGNTEDRLVSQLSDGYRNVLSLVMDFARRLTQSNPHLDDPLKSEAILLIDEIDLHLHPDWQQRIIPDLRKAFPGTQIITSTHSPQVLSSVKPESVLIHNQGSYVSANGDKTYGVESYRVLEDILGVSPEPKLADLEAKKNRYKKFIEENLGTSKEARDLEAELAQDIGRNSPFLVNARFEIARNEKRNGKS